MAKNDTAEAQFSHLLRTNLNAALDFLDTNQAQFNEAQRHLHYATAHFRLGNVDRASFHIRQGFESSPTKAQEIWLNSLLASIAMKDGDLELPIQYLTTGIELARANDLPEELFVMLSNRAQRYADMGNLNASLADLEEAEKLIDGIEDTKDKASFYNALSTANSKAANAQLAIEAAQTTISLLQKTQDTQQLSVIYYNLGHLYETQGLYLSARQAFYESLEYAKGSGDKLGVAYAQMGIGEMYLPKWREILSELEVEQDDPDLEKAIKYLHKAKAYFSENPNRPNMISIEAKLSYTYLLSGNLDKARKAASQVIAWASNTDLYVREDLMLAYRVMYLVHLARRENDLALTAFNQYDELVHNYYQSIYLKQVADSAKRLELSLIAYEKEKLALQNKAQSEQIDGQQVQLEQYLMYLTLAAVLCTMLGISLFYNSKMRKILARQAVTDELTQVANRRAIMQELDIAFRQVGVFSLAFIDIDFFKRINDTFGHQAGDLVLCQVADMLTKLLPDNARLGRYGGEEFLCILPGRNIAEAEAILDEVRATISEAKIKNIRQNTLSVSIGVAQRTKFDETYMQLLNRADEALYEAKENGRNQVRLAA